MRSRMPTLGQPRKQSSIGKLVLIALLAGGGAGGYWWKTHRPVAAPAPVAIAAAAPTTNTPAVDAPATQSAAPSTVQAGIKHLAIRINGPLEMAIDQQAGASVGPALTQVVTRALVWWVEVPGDFRKGDQLDVLYEERANEEPLVHAVRFESVRFGKTFAAYRYQVPGDSFARYHQPDGEELEMRLDASPLEDYEQITSLIRDGRHHKGVDFKTPVGSPVHATFAGVVTRKNWNWRSNGDCLEVTDSASGRKAMFLHLSEIAPSIKLGDHVKPGQLLAKSGNTGHSFAPHLHYQLMLGEERVLDPFAVQSAHRRSIAASARDGLSQQVQKLNAMFSTTLATK